MDAAATVHATLLLAALVEALSPLAEPGASGSTSQADLRSLLTSLEVMCQSNNRHPGTKAGVGHWA